MEGLTDMWNKTLERARLMDENLKENKMTFSNQTKV